MRPTTLKINQNSIRIFVMIKRRRGVRVAEGAPLLRVRSTLGSIFNKLKTPFVSTKTSITSRNKHVVTIKRPITSQSEDIYQTMIDVLQARLNEEIDDWSRDEFNELMDALIEMRDCRTKFAATQK